MLSASAIGLRWHVMSTTTNIHEAFMNFKVNFKGFMGDNAHANWNVVRKVYVGGDQTIPLEMHKCTSIHVSSIGRHSRYNNKGG